MLETMACMVCEKCGMLSLRREGIDIGREHTARLMRLAGVFWQK